MIKQNFFVKAVAAIALLSGGVALAHHSVSAQFDVDSTVMVKAVLAKVEWINPHPYLTFTVSDPDGTTHALALESMAPAALRRAGLAGKEALKVGEIYTLYFHPARNGKNTIGLMSAFTLPSGQTIGALTQKDLEQVEAIRKPGEAAAK